MDPELTYLYVDGESIGYGRMGKYIADELAARSITVYTDDGNPNSEERTRSGELLNNGRLRADSPTNLICWASVPSHMVGYFAGQHRAFITMWEAMTLPESFRETFHEIDTIIVPSPHNVELFSEFHDNVYYMPLGVDPALWHYIPPSPPAREFRFLINGRGERKGVDLAFKAFRTVFRDGTGFDPTPRLVMKSLRGHGQYYASNVEQVTGRLDPIAERDLYASCHAYIQPSRGEGFGLAPLQAIALGRPTILTGAHGHQSYAHLGIPISSTPSKADYFIYGDAGMWWEPDFEQLCEAMWDVYQNYANNAAAAVDSAQQVQEFFTWAHTTDRFVEILGAEMSVPYAGNHQWRKTSRRMFRIRVIRDFYTEIAGRTLQFLVGKDYWESADVKRILFDGGLLDPECLEGVDHGLAEQQVEQMDLMRARNEFCPHCHERVNTGEKLSDLIFEKLMSERANTDPKEAAGVG